MCEEITIEGYQPSVAVSECGQIVEGQENVVVGTVIMLKRRVFIDQDERERGYLYPCHIDNDNDQSTHIVAIDALMLRSVVRQLQPGEE